MLLKLSIIDSFMWLVRVCIETTVNVYILLACQFALKKSILQKYFCGYIKIHTIIAAWIILEKVGHSVKEGNEINYDSSILWNMM